MCGEREIERERERERERRTRKSVTEEEEEGTSIASDVVKVEGEDPATPGDYPRSVDTRTPQSDRERERENERERKHCENTPGWPYSAKHRRTHRTKRRHENMRKKW